MEENEINLNKIKEIIIGKKESELDGKIYGYRLRTVKENDEYLITTCEYDPNRINVEVENGKIKDVAYIG